MMRPSVQGVDPPVCCVLDVTVTYARDSFVDCQAGPFVPSRGGPGILAPVLQFLPLALFGPLTGFPAVSFSVVVRWYSVLRMTFCTRSIVSIKACVPCS